MKRQPRPKEVTFLASKSNGQWTSERFQCGETISWIYFSVPAISHDSKLCKRCPKEVSAPFTLWDKKTAMCWNIWFHVCKFPLTKALRSINLKNVLQKWYQVISTGYTSSILSRTQKQLVTSGKVLMKRILFQSSTSRTGPRIAMLKRRLLGEAPKI